MDTESEKTPPMIPSTVEGLSPLPPLLLEYNNQLLQSIAHTKPQTALLPGAKSPLIHYSAFTSIDKENCHEANMPFDTLQRESFPLNGMNNLPKTTYDESVPLTVAEEHDRADPTKEEVKAEQTLKKARVRSQNYRDKQKRKKQGQGDDHHDPEAKVPKNCENTRDVFPTNDIPDLPELNDDATYQGGFDKPPNAEQDGLCPFFFDLNNLYSDENGPSHCYTDKGICADDDADEDTSCGNGKVYTDL